MDIKNNGTSFFLYLLQICALILFLKGFFPMHELIAPHKTQEQKITRPIEPTINKLIVLVIDAMRTDFVNSTLHNHMPFLQSSIFKNRSCFMKVRTAAPTVTMPRIKAMTSGGIPNYVDVILNLGSSEFNEDTFLRQAALHNLRISFYGDDTWIKMFPKLFTRSGGTHSFFAADFWEVDKNVTQHVDNELKRNDWDILILHYLGLDHIGHMEGPFSNHIPQKLKEMDEIIQKIYDSVQLEKGLFIVTGDHGMKDSGGHGGVTDSEIHVPLISIGKKCLNLPGWPDVSEYTPYQIDIASTLSTLLGLPVPTGNMGKLIPALLNNLSNSKILRKLKEIKQQLIRHTVSLDEGYEITDEMLDSVLKAPDPDPVRLKHLTKQYFQELSDLSDKLSKQRSDFNLSYMAAGCFSLFLTIIAVFAVESVSLPSNSVEMTLTIGTVLHTISLASTSFIEEEHQTWYFLWPTLLVILLRQQLRRKFVAQTYTLDAKSCTILLLCIFHRFARKLNQTGDKWAHLPDWEDSLRPYPSLLLLMFLSGLLWLLKEFFDVNKNKWTRLTYSAGLLSIAVYRLAVASFDPFLQFYPQSRGSFEVTIFLIILFVIFYQTTLPNGPKFFWLWGLLIALTLRPHNLHLVPAQIYISRQLYWIFSRTENPFWNTLAHLWMGYLFYFYQGNSNSLANVDVAPAFIGSDSYNPVYAAILTLAHSYAAPIHAIILSPMTYQPILLSRLLPTSFFCFLVVFQRHHLFLWSVFAPKLLMDSTLTVVLFILIFIHAISIRIKK